MCKDDSGRKFGPINFKLGEYLYFCIPLDKFVGQKNWGTPSPFFGASKSKFSVFGPKKGGKCPVYKTQLLYMIDRNKTNILSPFLTF